MSIGRLLVPEYEESGIRVTNFRLNNFIQAKLFFGGLPDGGRDLTTKTSQDLLRGELQDKTAKE